MEGHFVFCIEALHEIFIYQLHLHELRMQSCILRFRLVLNSFNGMRGLEGIKGKGTCEERVDGRTCLGAFVVWKREGGGILQASFLLNIWLYFIAHRRRRSGQIPPK